MEIMRALEEMSLLQGLSTQELTGLARGAVWKVFAPNEFVFHQGDEARNFHVLHSGILKLFRSTAEGRDQTVYLVEEGDPFCLCSLYGAAVLPVSALTMTACQVIAFSVESMEKQLRRSPQVLLNIVRVLNTRLTYSYQMIEDLALRSIHQRVASFLLHAARVRDENAHRVTLSVSRQEVAKILGTTPETISRVLARLCQDGLIEAQGREIVLLDYQGMVDVAG